LTASAASQARGAGAFLTQARCSVSNPDGILCATSTIRAKAIVRLNDTRLNASR
jgi:hypothetical protein